MKEEIGKEETTENCIVLRRQRIENVDTGKWVSA